MPYSCNFLPTLASRCAVLVGLLTAEEAMLTIDLREADQCTKVLIAALEENGSRNTSYGRIDSANNRVKGWVLQ